MKSAVSFTGLCKMAFTGILAAALVAVSFLPVSALSDGAYLVNRTTSYTNPETGETVDGGTNIALGDSMADSIVEDQVLVEQTNGKIYVTMGLGLMSSVTNVRIQVQGADGSYHDIPITQTGSCTRIGDTCNHYRFEVESLDYLISPILYVDPMGRDVQFFVQLDPASAQAGTGNFVSEMIPGQSAVQTTPETPAEPTESAPVPEVSAASTPAASQSSEEGTPSQTSQAEEVSSTASTLSETASVLEVTSDLSGQETSELTSSGAASSSASVDGGMIAVIVVIVVLVVAGGAVLTVVLVRKKKDRR